MLAAARLVDAADALVRRLVFRDPSLAHGADVDEAQLRVVVSVTHVSSSYLAIKVLPSS